MLAGWEARVSVPPRLAQRLQMSNTGIVFRPLNIGFVLTLGALGCTSFTVCRHEDHHERDHRTSTALTSIGVLQGTTPVTELMKAIRWRGYQKQRERREPVDRLRKHHLR